MTETVGATTYIAECDTDNTNDITIKKLPSVTANSQISVRVNSIFGAAGTQAQISTIESFAGDLATTETIDKMTTPIAGWTITSATSAVLATDFKVFLTTISGTSNDTNKAGGADAADFTYYFKMKYQPSTEATNKDTTVTVHLPLSETALGDDHFYITSDTGFAAIEIKDSLDLNDGAARNMDGTGDNLKPPNLSAGNEKARGRIAWTLNNHANSVQATTEYSTVGIYRANSIPIGWPQVASNPATKYEATLEITNLDNSRKV
jgi:hypothetical protein